MQKIKRKQLVAYVDPGLFAELEADRKLAIHRISTSAHIESILRRYMRQGRKTRASSRTAA